MRTKIDRSRIAPVGLQLPIVTQVSTTHEASKTYFFLDEAGYPSKGLSQQSIEDFKSVPSPRFLQLCGDRHGAYTSESDERSEEDALPRKDGKGMFSEVLQVSTAVEPSNFHP